MKTKKIKFINILVLGLVLALLSGCGAKNVSHEEGLAIIPAKKPVSEYVSSDIVYPIDAYDPWVKRRTKNGLSRLLGLGQS